MGLSNLTARVKEFSRSTGLDLITITSAEPLFEAGNRIKEQIKKGLVPSRFRLKSVDDLCNPQSFLSGARSVITVGVCYLTSESEDLNKADTLYGIIARYTRKNYYKYTQKKLKKVVKFLKREFPQSEFKIYSCGLLREKPLAEKSGLGYYGKHGIIITKDFGSWIVLGEIITDLELEPDLPLQRNCGDCSLCIQTCPTKAIVEPGILDRKKCLSYLSTQMELPLEFREVWGNRLYNCDACQEVCPLNKKVNLVRSGAFSRLSNGVNPIKRNFPYGDVGKSFSLISILKMTEAEYRHTFKGNQMGANWVSRIAIQKNAVISLGNTRDSLAVPVLIESLENSEPTLRAHTAWALGKIGTKQAKSALEKALPKESETKVKNEIKDALEKI